MSRITLITAPPGTGKTTVALKKARDVRTLYFVRTHALAQEVAQKFRDLGNSSVAVYGGVMRSCAFLSAYERFPSRADFARHACRGCPEKASCSRACFDLEGPQLVVAPHAAAEYLLRQNADQGRVVIYDELPDVIHREEFSAELLAREAERGRRPGRSLTLNQRVAADAAAALYRALETVAASPTASPEALKWGVPVLGDRLRAHLQDVLTSQEKVAIRGTAGLHPTQLVSMKAEEIRRGHFSPEEIVHPGLVRLCRAVMPAHAPAGEKTDLFPVIHLRQQSPASAMRMKFEVCRVRDLSAPNATKIFLLDATGDLTMEHYEAAFGEEPEIAPSRVPTNPRYHKTVVLSQSVQRRQTLSASGVKARFVKHLGRALTMALADAEKRLGRPIKEVGLINSKSVIELVENRHPSVNPIIEALDEACTNVTCGYYWGSSRGTNRYEDCDVLITVGDPWSNLAEMEIDAAVLSSAIGRRVDGQDLAERAMQAELIQAHGRLRGNTRDEHVCAYHIGAHPPADWATDGDFSMLELRHPGLKNPGLELAAEYILEKLGVSSVSLALKLLDLPESDKCALGIVNSIWRTLEEIRAGSLGKSTLNKRWSMACAEVPGAIQIRCGKERPWTTAKGTREVKKAWVEDRLASILLPLSSEGSRDPSELADPTDSAASGGALLLPKDGVGGMISTSASGNAASRESQKPSYPSQNGCQDQNWGQPDPRMGISVNCASVERGARPLTGPRIQPTRSRSRPASQRARGRRGMWRLEHRAMVCPSARADPPPHVAGASAGNGSRPLGRADIPRARIGGGRGRVDTESVEPRSRGHPDRKINKLAVAMTCLCLQMLANPCSPRAPPGDGS